DLAVSELLLITKRGDGTLGHLEVPGERRRCPLVTLWRGEAATRGGIHALRLLLEVGCRLLIVSRQRFDLAPRRPPDEAGDAEKSDGEDEPGTCAHGDSPVIRRPPGHMPAQQDSPRVQGGSQSHGK